MSASAVRNICETDPLDATQKGTGDLTVEREFWGLATRTVGERTKRRHGAKCSVRGVWSLEPVSLDHGEEKRHDKCPPAEQISIEAGVKSATSSITASPTCLPALAHRKNGFQPRRVRLSQ
ncbi:hypothetical protein Bbelb_220380 [Branchiostoma belcheri]|nr:hypothetical protein Bbelb_220380 [Branchiostoma belcheri]